MTERRCSFDCDCPGAYDFTFFLSFLQFQSSDWNFNVDANFNEADSGESPNAAHPSDMSADDFTRGVRAAVGAAASASAANERKLIEFPASNEADDDDELVVTSTAADENVFDPDGEFTSAFVPQSVSSPSGQVHLSDPWSPNFDQAPPVSTTPASSAFDADFDPFTSASTNTTTSAAKSSSTPVTTASSTPFDSDDFDPAFPATSSTPATNTNTTSSTQQ